MIARNLFRALRRRDGQALVEFALVVPMLLLLLLGIFEFARAWNVYQVIQDASREATRRLVVEDNLTQTEYETTVNSALQRAGLAPFATVPTPDGCRQSFCSNSASAESGTITTVTLSYPYGFVALGKLLPLPPITLTATAKMRNE